MVVEIGGAGNSCWSPELQGAREARSRGRPGLSAVGPSQRLREAKPVFFLPSTCVVIGRETLGLLYCTTAWEVTPEHFEQQTRLKDGRNFFFLS